MRRDRVELVLASALMLFTELVLIRWTGANVVYLSYFTNFVLLGSFLGIGIGFLRASRPTRLFPWAPVLLAFFATLITAFPVVIDRTGTDLVYFGGFQDRGLPAWVMLPLIFVAVAATMAAIADGVAARFARFQPLDAYALDILGSLLGVAAFAALAFLGTPPLAWGAAIAAGFLFLLGPERRLLQVGSLAVLVFVLGVSSFQRGTSWSPYYRVQSERIEDPRYGVVVPVAVNGIPHQAAMSTEVRRRFEPAYFVPYERREARPLGGVLIVGAGTGSDVAIALEAGARRVDAVEIDPELYRLGVGVPPDRPYGDPRVHVHITDGRAFLENGTRRYDLIVFALPDSLTIVGGQSALRLESYLFTREAFEAARSRLAPGGAFAMYNYYRERWLVDRLAGTLGDVFGASPCLDEQPLGGPGSPTLSVMVAGVDGTGIRCARTWEPGEAVVAPATDDRPFVYLRDRAIPTPYLAAMLLVVVASAIAVRAAGGPLGRIRGSLDLFFMGGAFLLLETMNVVRFALLFGTTWFVNALVFAGVLLTVLLAVLVERRFRVGHPRLLYASLFVAIGIALAVPGSALLSLPFGARFVVATALAFAPIFIANLVFAQRFHTAEVPTAAFGANLLGAMLGGVVEYFSLVTGYRALLVLAAVFYALAWITGRRRLLVAPERSPSPDDRAFSLSGS
jgi:hypothetical protein